MVLLETLAFVIGAMYGYLKPGKEDRLSLFKKSLLIGILLGLIFTGLGMIVNVEFLLLSSIIGIVMFVQIMIVAVFFIIGTYIGDILEEKSKANKQ